MKAKKVNNKYMKLVVGGLDVMKLICWHLRTILYLIVKLSICQN